MRADLAGTAGVEPASFRVTSGRSAFELHARKLVHRDGFEPSTRRASTDRSASELPVQCLVERAGVEPAESIGRLLYKQLISPVIVSPVFGADGEYRPHNLLVTNQLLCCLSYISVRNRDRRPQSATQRGL